MRMLLVSSRGLGRWRQGQSGQGAARGSGSSLLCDLGRSLPLSGPQLLRLCLSAELKLPLSPSGMYVTDVWFLGCTFHLSDMPMPTGAQGCSSKEWGTLRGASPSPGLPPRRQGETDTDSESRHPWSC